MHGSAVEHRLKGIVARYSFVLLYQTILCVQMMSTTFEVVCSTLILEECSHPLIIMHVGPNYLPAYARGTRAGIQELAPSLLGLDPTNVNKMNMIMDYTLKGHPYVKSAIDMACWDILGRILA